MNKRIVIIVISVLLIIVLCSAVKRDRAITKKDDVINYQTARELYEKKDYDKSYKYFNTILSKKTDTLINDYIIYYLAQSVLNIEDYDNAITNFYRVEKEYPSSSLSAYAKQYRVLSEFYRDNYPVSNFFESKDPKWIKEFVGIKAFNKVYKENKDLALLMLDELISRYSNSDAFVLYDRYYKNIATNKDFSFVNKMASNLYKAGVYKSAGVYYNIIKIDKKYEEESLYYLARISQLLNSHDNAIKLYNDYITNKNYKTYRKDALYYMAETYHSQRDFSNSDNTYKIFINEYKTDNYIPRAYRRLILNELRAGNFTQAKNYLTNSIAKFPSSSYTDISVRNYLRFSFNGKNKDESYFALDEIKKLYSQNRPEYARSWAIWVYNNFNDTNKKNMAVLDTLLNTKNPHYIKEALTFADENILKRVEASNEYYYKEALKHYNKSNYASSMSSLNKVQFIDYITTGEYTPILEDVRSLAHSMMTNKPFLKSYYSNMSETDILTDLQIQTRSNADKSILLYHYKDYDNAYNEYKKAIKNIPVTYPVFYFAKKIYSAALNTREFFSFSYRIGSHFGYNYQLNVDLLPDEMKTYIYPRYFDEYVLPEAKHYKIEPAFVYAIMREESLFDVKAKSWANAYGLMQLITSTAKMENNSARYKFDPLNLNDPKQNIYLGTAHLSALFKNEGNSNYMIVAANYNAGSSNGKKWKELYGTTNMYYTARLIDFDETEYYIERVMKSYEYYKMIYKDF